MTVGERIRLARKKEGLTQKQLGEKCGIAEPTIRRYELGKLNPKYETLKKIAHALEISTYELLGEEERELFVEGEASALIHGLGKNYSFSEQEQALVLSFNNLNQTGKNEAVKRVGELTKIDEYTAKESDKDK